MCVFPNEKEAVCQHLVPVASVAPQVMGGLRGASVSLCHSTGIEAEAVSQRSGAKEAISHHKAELCSSSGEGSLGNVAKILSEISAYHF